MKINPFLKTYDTPHGAIPFDKITLEDYEPAFIQGMKEEDEEIKRIISNEDEPNFENTILALENSGKTLEKVSNVFFNLLSAETSDKMQEIAEKVQPLLTEHNNNISLNRELFERVKKVWENEKNLEGEDARLLENCYDSFRRSGANLSDEDKQKIRELSMKVSMATLRYGQNCVNEIKDYTLHVTDSSRLEGMPARVLESAEETAREKGLDGWAFTLQAPSYQAMMQYCKDRELRKEIAMAYGRIGCQDNDRNNRQNVIDIVNTKMEIARILGFEDLAQMKLSKRMASDKKTVMDFLSNLLGAYKEKAMEDVREVERYAKDLEGEDFKLRSWDFSYYSNLLRKEKYDYDPEMTRPYLKVDKVIDGVFSLATRLYGITFRRNDEIPVFHPDMIPFEVLDENGEFLAVLYTDFYPRDGKHSGAWMTTYREQQIDKNGVNIRPLVSITTNFTKPTSTKPALLSLGEVSTFLHEFGHALHAIFANTRYKSMSGTNVYWDFVELPSQFMENYAREEAFLSPFARHYETSEPLPSSLLERILNAGTFLSGYSCLRQLSFGFLDMAYYTSAKPLEEDINLEEYEYRAWKDCILIPRIEGTAMSTNFSHIMSGGYSAGYYSYKWAEVLDADAFSYFKETGIFNKETAGKFRKMLSKGGTEHPMDIYKEFRGKEPSIDALLVRDGIKKNN